MSIIAITGSKGGVGVTTLATNIAAAMSVTRQTRLLAFNAGRDWSLHLKDLMERTHAQPPLSWTPDTATVNFWDGAHVITPTLRVAALSNSDYADSDILDLNPSVMTTDGADNPLIIDTPVHQVNSLLKSAPGGVLLHVMNTDAVSLAAAMEWRRTHPANSDALQNWDVKFVLNMVDPRRSLCRDLEIVTAEAFGSDLLPSIRMDAAFPNAAAQGALVADHAPESSASLAVRELSEALQDISFGQTEEEVAIRAQG